MEFVKEQGRTLGFSIAGGRGSTPAYEDVDEVLHYIIIDHCERFIFVYVFDTTLSEYLCDEDSSRWSRRS